MYGFEIRPRRLPGINVKRKGEGDVADAMATIPRRISAFRE